VKPSRQRRANAKALNPGGDPADRDVARGILQYIRDHPAAKDTLEGIAWWWLQGASGERSLAEVERAVAYLLAKGFVVERRRPGLSPYYHVNRQKLDEIARLLESWGA
jgi:hypothetical protein